MKEFNALYSTENGLRATYPLPEKFFSIRPLFVSAPTDGFLCVLPTGAIQNFASPVLPPLRPLLPAVVGVTGLSLVKVLLQRRSEFFRRPRRPPDDRRKEGPFRRPTEGATF